MEEWPVIHMDPTEVNVPYNGSKFELKSMYKSTFPQFDVKDSVNETIYNDEIG